MSGYDFTQLEECDEKAVQDEADKYSELAELFVNNPDWDAPEKKPTLVAKRDLYWRYAVEIRAYARQRWHSNDGTEGVLSEMRRTLEAEPADG